MGGELNKGLDTGAAPALILGAAHVETTRMEARLADRHPEEGLRRAHEFSPGDIMPMVDRKGVGCSSHMVCTRGG